MARSVGLNEFLDSIEVRVTKPMLMHVGNQAAIKLIQGEESAARENPSLYV